MAAEMVAKSTNIILQNSDEQDIVVFKLNKLEFPNVKISLAVNGKVEKEQILPLEGAFPILVDAVEMLCDE